MLFLLLEEGSYLMKFWQISPGLLNINTIIIIVFFKLFSYICFVKLVCTSTILPLIITVELQWLGH